MSHMKNRDGNKPRRAERQAQAKVMTHPILGWTMALLSGTSTVDLLLDSDYTPGLRVCRAIGAALTGFTAYFLITGR